MMKYKVKRVLFVGLFFFLPFPFCFAGDDKVGISVEQAVFSFNLWPGQEQDFFVDSKSIIEKQQKISLGVVDFSISKNNQISFLADRNEIYGMSGWISLDEKDWITQAYNESKSKITINVPEDASVGSHYCVLLLSALPMVDGENFQKPLVGGQIGVYVLVNVLGEISGKGKIESFQAPKLAKEENDLEIVFKNEGNVHYIPHGGIETKNIFTGGKEDEKLSKHFVFPGKSFSFEHKWHAPSLFGAYFVKAYFVDQDGQNLFEEKLVFGKFFPFALGGFSLLVLISFLVYRFLRKKVF